MERSGGVERGGDCEMVVGTGNDSSIARTVPIMRGLRAQTSGKKAMGEAWTSGMTRRETDKTKFAKLIRCRQKAKHISPFVKRISRLIC